MSETDEEIIEEVLAGNTQIFEVLVNRYERPVYNLMYRYSNNVEEAADLTQDVFLSVFRNLSTFKQGKGFFSWMYTIALNRARDWARKNNRQMIKLQEFIHVSPQVQPSYQPTVEKEEEYERVMKALELLPVETREILILRYRHERSIQEVAEVFEISLSAAKMRIKRGLEALQKLLEEEGDYEPTEDKQRRN